MMKPSLALVGRPNVGKSTLFNRLTKSRQALVADQPGLTRDRIYGTGQFDEDEFIVIDTAGLGEEQNELHNLMSEQSRLAMSEADAVLFLVDGRGGLTSSDEEIAAKIRRLGKQVYLVVNKTEGLNRAIICAEFQRLGLGEPYAISSAHGEGVAALMQAVLARIPRTAVDDHLDEESGIKVAIVGRPNVGKSTLVNRMLGEERVLVYDAPGTTRDSIFIPFEREGQRYTLIDTAGVRRRSKVDDVVEKFSVLKTLQAIDVANVVVLVIDARIGVTDQDATLAGFILETGRALVISLNKWDGMTPDDREKAKTDVDRKLHFLDFAKHHYISALHGTGVGNLFDSIIEAYTSATIDLSTPRLNKILEQSLVKNPPPLVKGRRIKLRYAHQGGRNPPIIIIHGSQTADVPDAYQRYLSNTFRRVLKLRGTPVRIEFRSGENPYRDKKNTLTDRQIAKKKRLRKHVTRSKK